ncbi:MAG: DUF2842 domain-containing protein [Hyphomicrobiaceae bacterium]|nr:DUF2842 domain-containing protein [Hyphomicrobiaceae bacterium]
MSSRSRKLVGAVLLLVLIVVYSFLMLAAAVALEVNTTSKWIELAFYVVAGLAWVLPAGVIIKWMSAAPPPDDSSARR